MEGVKSKVREKEEKREGARISGRDNNAVQRVQSLKTAANRNCLSARERPSIITRKSRKKRTRSRADLGVMHLKEPQRFVRKRRDHMGAQSIGGEKRKRSTSRELLKSHALNSCSTRTNRTFFRTHWPDGRLRAVPTE